MTHSLGSDPEDPQEHSAGGLVFRLTRRREITIANRGVRPADPKDEPLGFAVCKECGYTEEDKLDDEHPDDDVEVEQRGHATRCPARRDPTSDVVLRGSWLIARLVGDVLEMPLGPGQEAPGFTGWRRTLTEALMLGIRETMQAGRRDLEAFEVAPNGEPKTLVIFDTMPGGTGYLPKLLAEGGAGLREAAATALERLAGCDCEKSCHRCLRDFWNQRNHRVLDRHAVIPTLRRLATAPGIDYEPEPDEQLASFLEREFFQRLEAAGIQAPTLQGIHRLPDGGITVADALYADPDISVYLDGREYHSQSVERIRADLHRRNQLEQQGRLVLEFTYNDVLKHFDDVAALMRDALEGGVDRTPAAVPQDGPSVMASDLEGGRLEVAVDAAAWVRDEAERQRHLAAANAARLNGWRLNRR